MIKPWMVLGAVSLSLAQAPARADDAPPAGAKSPERPTPETPPTPPKPKPPARWTPAPKLPPLPVKLTLTAPTPDPPWRVRIENTGDVRIRIPADIRLLSVELTEPGGKSKKKRTCSAPAAMKPSGFPKSRELFLEPGDAWEEELDPRLLCFGGLTDALREGVVVTPKFGFGGRFGRSTSFAAQGTDRPQAYAAQAEITGEPVQPASPIAAAAASSNGAAPPQGERPRHAQDGEPRPEPRPRPHKGDHEHGQPGSPPPPPGALASGNSTNPIDRNGPELDIYVSRFAEAGNPRDLVVTIHAVNEGGRALATVVRGRMLAFRVEELGTDNTPRATTECRGQDHPHAIPIEAVANVRPGRQVQVPILLAEICPRATFARPGLYRVLPVLDSTVVGEVTEVDPHVGQALARQSSLVRVATSQVPFYQDAPMSEQGKREAARRAKAEALMHAESRPPTAATETKKTR